MKTKKMPICSEIIDEASKGFISRQIRKYESLTTCHICKHDCGSMAGLIMHVHKFHPRETKEA